MIGFEDFKKVDIRTAKVLEVKDHPNADKLLILKIEVGGEVKQVVAGIKGQYAKEDLLDKDIVVINNLEPAVIRGEESEAMALVAQNEGIMSLVVPNKKIKSGSLVK